ncbi:MAG: ABC transporter substrate-binding protein, partial [Actinomycetes bacterium]
YGDEVEVSGSSFEFTGTFGSEHPTGTGPFRFESWKRGDKLTLERYDHYWGEKAKLATLIYKPIPDGQARRQALENGEIDGYDNVAPQDVDALTSGDYVLEERPSSNVGYLGFNRSFKPLDNVKVRQSMAHAINREALLEAMYPPGSLLAEQWVPPSMSLDGTESSAPSYDYDPVKAKQLLDDSGVSTPTLELWYATGVTRPYMPDPKAIASTFKADLEKVGFTVNVKGVPWTPDFLGALRGGEAPMYIVGLLPDLADPSQYFGTFDDAGRWGDLPRDLVADIDAAESETDPARRVTMYEHINAEAMEDLPGLPLVHGVTHLAFAPEVTGFSASPVFAESMAT